MHRCIKKTAYTNRNHGITPTNLMIETYSADPTNPQYGDLTLSDTYMDPTDADVGYVRFRNRMDAEKAKDELDDDFIGGVKVNLRTHTHVRTCS